MQIFIKIPCIVEDGLIEWNERNIMTTDNTIVIDNQLL